MRMASGPRATPTVTTGTLTEELDDTAVACRDGMRQLGYLTAVTT
jgi:hypothetical protein